MRFRRREGAAGLFGSARDGSGLSRREILAGGIGTGALIALPDLDPSGRSGVRPAASGRDAFRYAFLYGLPDPAASPGASVVAVMCPASRSAPRHAPVPVATKLAAAPVSSPDQTTTALATVHNVDDGARVTLTLIDTASAAIAEQGSVTVAGVPDGANILVTPVFAPGSTIIALVLAITVPVTRRLIHKAHPAGGAGTSRWATTWSSHHALAYFDRRSGSFAGPFHLSNEPSLALSTAAANNSDLLLWTTREPQPGDPAETRSQALLSRVSVFPLGSGKARFSGPAPAPWPAGEPVVTLPNGDVARLVRGRDVQVCSARTGKVTELAVAPLSRIRAKPSAVTMQTCPDGTVFMTKPGAGVAVVADPADSFRVRAHIRFPATRIAARRSVEQGGAGTSRRHALRRRLGPHRGPLRLRCGLRRADRLLQRGAPLCRALPNAQRDPPRGRDRESPARVLLFRPQPAWHSQHEPSRVGPVLSRQYRRADIGPFGGLPAMSGYDTAGKIHKTYASAHREFGVDPAFWIRYFTPSPAADLFSDDAVAESRGAWDSGGHYVGCISAPRQSRLSGSAAEGQADAQAFCASMLAAYHAVGPLRLPSGRHLYCWLDQEYSTSLSSDYWDAWAHYVAEYDFAGLGIYPLYPGLYCDAYSPYPNCSTIANARGVDGPAPSGRASPSRAAAWPNRPTGIQMSARRCGPGSGSTQSRTRANCRPMWTST